MLATASLHAVPPNYEDHIFPILEQSCTNCHNPDKQKGGLDVSTYAALMRGGSGGKVAEPGEGADSRIYGMISHTLKPKMPPKGEKLEKKDADLIRAWIDGGLLENKSGKPKKKKKPVFTLKAASSTKKPERISMPRHVLLDPVVTSTQGSVVSDMASSPWAPLLAVTGQRQVLLYHTGSLQLVGILPFEPGQPEALSFHPSGKYLLAGGGIGGKSGSTVTWDVETGKEILRAGKDFDSCIAASLRSDLGGVSFGGPGKRVKLWNTSTDEQFASIKKHTDWVTQLAYSPDGVLLASGGRGGGVHVWEAETGNPFHELRGHKAAITGVAWRSDSNLLATASEDGTVLVWGMNNGRQVKKINAHGGGVLSLDWTRNGYLVTSGRDNKVKIWKPDFNLLKELPKFPNIITEVAFSFDGKRIFAADWLGNITVWDTTKGKQIGAIVMNPPAIATRIRTLDKELASLPAQIAAAEKSAQQKTVAHTTAKAHLTKLENEHRTTLARHHQLKTERVQLDTRLKKLHAEAGNLNKQRQQCQQVLVHARDTLNKHNKTVTDMRNQCRHADNELKKLTAHEQHLAKMEQAARKQSEAKPDNPTLRQAADKAKMDLENHRKKLTATRTQAQQKSTALAQLQKQQQGSGNQLAAADKAHKEILAKTKAHHDVRKPLQEKRSTLNKPITDTYNRAKHIGKQIKPAREKIKPAETAVQQAQNHLDHLRNQSITKRNAIKHWKAAAINAEAIRLKKEAEQLTSAQHQAMDAFTILAKEIQQIKDPAKLREKTNQLAKLRQEIDQQAPSVLEKTKQAAQRKAVYHAALK